jgi:hypothetical protein
MVTTRYFVSVELDDAAGDWDGTRATGAEQPDTSTAIRRISRAIRAMKPSGG